MHTTTLHNFDDEGYPLDDFRYTFVHNGSYSGNVRIMRTVEGQGWEIEIPFDVLKEFVGQAMQSKQIEHLEGLNGREFLDEIL